MKSNIIEALEIIGCDPCDFKEELLDVVLKASIFMDSFAPYDYTAKTIESVEFNIGYSYAFNNWNFEQKSIDELEVVEKYLTNADVSTDYKLGFSRGLLEAKVMINRNREIEIIKDQIIKLALSKQIKTNNIVTH